MASEKSKGFDWAVKNGDLSGVQEFVEKDKVDVNMVDNNKRTACHWASDYGQLEILQYLVTKGARYDQPDRFGITPILAAVYEGHANVVRFLVEKGVNLKVAGPDGRSLVESAEKEEIKKILQKK